MRSLPKCDDYEEENVLDTCLIIERRKLFVIRSAPEKSYHWPYASASDSKVTYVSSATSANLCDVGHNVSHFPHYYQSN